SASVPERAAPSGSPPDSSTRWYSCAGRQWRLAYERGRAWRRAGVTGPGGAPASMRAVPVETAQRPERRPDLGREQLRLFRGSEVAALAGLVVVGEVGVALLDPAARGPEDLAGERGETDRDLDLRRRLSGRKGLRSSALPVRPR